MGKHVARIDYELMDALGIKPSHIMKSRNVWIGDRIEISSLDGRFSTYAACVPLYPSDEGKGMIRIDKQTRENLDNIGIGQKVRIRKVDFFAAKAVTIELIDSVSQLDNAYLQDRMDSYTIKEGDVVSLPDEKDTMITFRVSKINPKTKSTKGKAAVIAYDTQFTIVTANSK